MSTLPSVEAMLARLVASESVSSPDPAHDRSNGDVIAMLAEWAESLGFRVELRPVSGTPRKQNLVATLGEGEGGLVLSGHSDTVPYDAGQWGSDPFEVVERDGKLFGLGTADMKGFFASALEAVRRTKGRALRRPLVLVATADEESTMAGARLLSEQGIPGARFAVIGEPTGLRPIRKHKGILMERLRVAGRSGHSSDPSLGANAIEGMMRVIEAIAAYRRDLARDHADPELAVPVPTINLGRIEGGDSPNRICPSCTLDVDVRLTPSLAIDAARAGLRAAAERAIAGTPFTIEHRPLVEGIPSFEIAADAELVRAAEAIAGHDAETVLFGTEAPFYASLGLETVILGPGDIRVAHQPDEHTTREALSCATDLYAKMMGRFCIEGES